MLYFQESGLGNSPAVVFLHGGGLSSKMWQPQMERLPEYHILAPDLPAQGHSIDKGPFTLQGSAAEVAQLIQEHIPLRRAHLVGLSLGGAVALAVLKDYPQLVESVLVTGTAAGLGKFLGTVSMASAGLYRLFPTDTLVKASLKQFGIPPQYHDLVRADLQATSTAEFTREFTQALMEMQLPTQAECPVLVVVGEKETLPAKQAARKLVQVIPDARGALVPGLGHVWNLQDPGLFSRVVKLWVDRQEIAGELKAIMK